MYADTRSAINTLAQANDMAEELNSPWVGVAVDVYHLWWYPMLEKEIKRCGENGNLMAFHICDWKLPTTDMLFDRGLMGEGCIPVKKRSDRGWKMQVSQVSMKWRFFPMPGGKKINQNFLPKSLTPIKSILKK